MLNNPLAKMAVISAATILFVGCGEKDNAKEKEGSTSGRIAQAQRIGVSIETAKCDYDAAKSCISRISWQNVGSSDSEKHSAIDALEALKMAIVADPNPTLDKNQMTFLIDEAREAIGRETEAFKLKMLRKAR